MMDPVSAGENLRHLADLFVKLIPHLRPNILIWLSAISTIICASHASLSRPATAAEASKPKDNNKEDEVERLEFSMREALMMPLIAGTMLASFYFLIIYGADQILNRILGVVACMHTVGALITLSRDALNLLLQFIWPSDYIDLGQLWSIRSRLEQVEGTNSSIRYNPLPGRLGRLRFSRAVNSKLWTIRNAMSQNYDITFKLGFFRCQIIGPTTNMAAFAVTTILTIYTAFSGTPWYLMNLQGAATTYITLGILAPDSFLTATVLLTAMFFYDIYMVFYTPMMMTVATSLQVPVKMVFPKASPDPTRPDFEPDMMMLGLGDVLLPGLLCAMALRFDLWRAYLRKQTRTLPESGGSLAQSNPGGQESNQPTDFLKAPYEDVTGKWALSFWYRKGTAYSLGAEPDVGPQSAIPTFPKPYFLASLLGYTIGLATTLIVLVFWNHAQPALLYLCPGVLGATWLLGLARGEVGLMLSFGRDAEGPELDALRKARQAEQEQEQEKERGEQPDGASIDDGTGGKDPQNADMERNRETENTSGSRERSKTHGADERFFVFRFRAADPDAKCGIWIEDGGDDVATDRAAVDKKEK